MVKVKDEVEVGLVEQVFKALKATDLKAVEKVASNPDPDVVRPAIAKLVIEGAQKAAVLTTVRRSSTMRELLYNLVATDTKKSKKMHTMNKASAKQTIKTLKETPEAVLIFSAMYPKRMSKLA